MSKRWIAVLSVVFFFFVGFSSLTPVLASGACHVAWISADPPNGVALGQNATFTTAVFCDSGAKVGSVQISGFSTVIAAADGQTTVSGTAVMTVSGTVEIQVRVYPKGDPFSMELKTMNYTVFPKEGAATVSSPPQQAVVPTATADVVDGTMTYSEDAGEQDCPPTNWVKVVTLKINVRKKPALDAEVLAMAPQGKCFSKLGDVSNESGNWFYVQSSQGTGYVKNSSKYTQSDSTASVQAAATPTIPVEFQGGKPVDVITTVVVNPWKVNLRDGASLKSTIIGYALKGDQLHYVISSADGVWYYVQDSNGIVGWVMKKFVRITVGKTEIRVNDATTGSTPAATSTPMPTVTAGSATIVACPGAPASRLFEQKSAKSTPDGDPLAIRILPGTDATKLGSIPNGKSVDITGAPECHGGMYWYPVTYLNISGWSAEGITEKWFLEPVGEATPEPTAVG